jgi:hypothetical protein
VVFGTAMHRARLTGPMPWTSARMRWASARWAIRIAPVIPPLKAAQVRTYVAVSAAMKSAVFMWAP